MPICYSLLLLEFVLRNIKIMIQHSFDISKNINSKMFQLYPLILLQMLNSGRSYVRQLNASKLEQTRLKRSNRQIVVTTSELERNVTLTERIHSEIMF